MLRSHQHRRRNQLGPTSPKKISSHQMSALICNKVILPITLKTILDHHQLNKVKLFVAKLELVPLNFDFE